MKFAFIENRYKTIFWSSLSTELRSYGHEVVWLVQNPIFSPSGEPIKSIYIAPFPRKCELVSLSLKDGLDRAYKADRHSNYFSGDNRHYHHYQTIIEKWLDSEKPDVVIGESTLFHELIVVETCRKKNILYLHPSMPGYPGGRFSIYAYDKKEPLGISGDVPNDAECLAMAEAICKHERIPEYMIPPSGTEPERKHPLPRSFQDRLMILRGYLAGERYNTPSPLKKWLLDRQVKRRLKIWQQITEHKAQTNMGHRIALYPLQLQPEANIDVWGQEFRNQAQLVSQLADALPDGWLLNVKANPKSKYEVSDELLDILRYHPKVSPVSLTKSMASVFSAVDLVCTVTGTVAVECVLSRKPLVQFGPGVVEPGPGCVQLGIANEVSDVIRSIESNSYKLATDVDRIHLVRKLYATTFHGKVSDPANHPAVMAEENVRIVARTIIEVAKRCK